MSSSSDDHDARRTWLEPTWIEQLGSGFPSASTGARLRAIARSGDADLAPSVLDERSGVPLTSTHVDGTLAFAEFLAGAAFPAVEHRYLREVILSDYADNPPAAIQSCNQVLRALVQIPGMDPERRATQRGQSVRDIKFAEIANDVTTPIMETIERYNPVLLVDTAANRVITGDALDAYWSMYDMFASLVDLEPSTLEARVDLASSLPEMYAEWTPSVRSEVGSARSRWVALRAVIRSMSDAEFGSFRSNLLEEIEESDDLVAAVIGFGLSAGTAALTRRVEQRLATTQTS